MNNEMQKTSFDAGGHPDPNQLLLALEGELTAAETAQIDRHLGACWNCRARSHEMHRGILAFVEYREKLYLPELESPPQEFLEFPSLLNNAADEDRKPGLLERI